MRKESMFRGKSQEYRQALFGTAKLPTDFEALRILAIGEISLRKYTHT
jgi:hypothetical protein